MTGLVNNEKERMLEEAYIP